MNEHKQTGQELGDEIERVRGLVERDEPLDQDYIIELLFDYRPMQDEEKLLWFHNPKPNEEGNYRSTRNYWSKAPAGTSLKTTIRKLLVEEFKLPANVDFKFYRIKIVADRLIQNDQGLKEIEVQIELTELYEFGSDSKGFTATWLTDSDID